MVSLRYGISVRNGPEDWSQSAGRLDNSVFSAIELGGGVLERGLEKTRDLLEEWECVRLSDVMPPAIPRSVCEQGRRLAEKFREQFDLLVERAASLGASAIVMDYAVESTRGRLPARMELLRILKSLAPALYRNSVRLCFPVRVPYTHTWMPEHVKNFLVDVMNPCFSVSLDLYLNELGMAYSARDLARWLRFDIEQVRVIYEPGLDSRPSGKTLSQWTDYLRRNCFEGPVIFCPKLKGDSFYGETDYLAGLVEELEK